MKIDKLNSKERLPDNYRAQVISKLEELNNKIHNIKNSIEITDNRRSVYCYEINWLKGNYTYTDIHVGTLYTDLPRIYNLIDKIEKWEKFPNNKYRKQYLEYFFLENLD